MADETTEEEEPEVKVLRNMRVHSVSLVTLPEEPWPGWAMHIVEEGATDGD